MTDLYTLFCDFFFIFFPAEGLREEFIVGNDWIIYVLTWFILLTVFVLPWFIALRRRKK